MLVMGGGKVGDVGERGRGIAVGGMSRACDSDCACACAVVDGVGDVGSGGVMGLFDGGSSSGTIEIDVEEALDLLPPVCDLLLATAAVAGLIGEPSAFAARGETTFV